MFRSFPAVITIAVAILAPLRGQSTGGILSTPFEAINIPDAPFCARDVTEKIGLDGNPVKGRREIVYLCRDSAGRTRVEIHSGTDSQPEWIVTRIFDTVAGHSYEVLPANRRFSRHDWAPPVPLGAGSWQAAPSKIPEVFPGIVYSNPIVDGAVSGIGQAEGHFKTAWELLPEQLVAGVPAEGMRLVTTFQAGAVGNEDEFAVEHVKWVSRKLRITLFDSVSDPRYGRHVRRLTDVRMGEPDPSLFVIPPDYSERP